MRIAVDHRTRYRFTEPQARVVEVLRLTPSDTGDQTVVQWRIDVDCDARLREARDGFGNAVTMLYAQGPLHELEVSVSGEVLTTDSSGVIQGAVEPLPELIFLRSTPRTIAGEAIAAVVGETALATDPLERLHRLNALLNARFPEQAAGRDWGGSAEEAFVRAEVTPRDLAHIFIAAARVFGAPARYVSGYRQADCGTCWPHGWAEAFVERLGWVAFDPSAGICTDERYVRVAVALDATGAAPIVGQRIGLGDEALDVDLQVERLNGEE